MRALTDKEVREFRQKIVETGIRPVVGHLPYTVNLGAEEKRLSDFARQVVAEDLGRCDLLGAEFLVTHPGRHGGDLRAGLERVVRLLAQALEGREYRAILLLETMAGQGNEIGGDFSELAFILEALGWPERVGVCLDTAHLYAAGWDISSEEGIDRMLEELDRLIGLSRVKVVHINDSLVPCGSRRDRHALIGRGELGPEGMAAIVNHRFLKTLPGILETPVGGYEEYASEARAVRALVKGPPDHGLIR